jgi:hypothetical protein
MLTDIFADRYRKRVIWEQYAENESKLLMQCYRIIEEQVMPYWIGGKETEAAKAKWKSVHDRLSMELGLDELAPRYYAYPATMMGRSYTHTGTWTLDKVCKDFMTAQYQGTVSPDRFIKERISFVELAFRHREEELAELQSNSAARQANALLRSLRRAPHDRGDPAAEDKAFVESLNLPFRQSVDELNERLRRAGVPLNYHNGFIQISTDELVEENIEKPFWGLLSDPLWRNVDVDMKEALDRRDGGDRDPAFYAARALESAIKIISDKKGFTRGTEKGAHAYLDNLGSEKNGNFIQGWERDALKCFFTAVRNPLGHGPGNEKMPELFPGQTDWAIETCMSWIRTLIVRM